MSQIIIGAAAPDPADSPLEKLKRRIPGIIADMSEEFSTHEIIEVVEQWYPQLYTSALANDACSPDDLHSRIGSHLKKLPHLVEAIGWVKSQNKCGSRSACRLWKKRQP